MDTKQAFKLVDFVVTVKYISLKHRILFLCGEIDAFFRDRKGETEMQMVATVSSNFQGALDSLFIRLYYPACTISTSSAQIKRLLKTEGASRLPPEPSAAAMARKLLVDSKAYNPSGKNCSL